MSEKPPLPVTTPAPVGAVGDPFGAHPTPSFGTPAMLSDVKREERRTNAALAEAETSAAKKAWFAGWAAGIAGVVAAVGLAFLVWFRGEAMAQEKSNNALELAKSHTDKSVAEVKASVSEVKSSVDTVAYKVDEQNKKLDEIAKAVKELARSKRREKEE